MKSIKSPFTLNLLPAQSVLSVFPLRPLGLLFAAVLCFSVPRSAEASIYFAWPVKIGAMPVNSYVLAAPKCDAALSFKFSVTYDPASGTNAPVSPWLITVTDVNGHSVSTGTLHHDSVIPWARIVESGGATPALDMTGLDTGAGSMTLTKPDGTTISYPFEIVNCTAGSALKVSLNFDNRIAPNRAMPYYLRVVNLGPASVSASTMEITGIPGPANCTVNAYSAGTTAGPDGAGQKITVTPITLSPGDTSDYWFNMQATPSAVVGSSFTLNAAFTSIYPYTDSRLINVVASIDPNSKSGPIGFGSLHNVDKNTALPYVVTFENDPAAPVPAQVVTVTDHLDTSKVEPASFAFGPVFFGTQVFTPPAGMIPFTMTVPYDVDNDPITTLDNIYVRITGNLDKNLFSPNFGEVTWTFESLDAPNGNPPDISIGFLPPNNNAPEGDGGVMFTVMQKESLSSATLISNRASIVFDANAPILTPVWTNKIATPATLAIDTAANHKVRVTWTGGILEQSSSITGGPWTNSPVQVSPRLLSPSEPKKFFRVRRQ